LLAKAEFYVSVAAFTVFAGASFFLFDKDRTVPEIPATHTEAEVISETKAFLETITHRGLKLQDPETTGAETFKDAEFKAEYLFYRSWRINAYYSVVRYFWRVDDASLEVTQDGFLTTLNASYNLKLARINVSAQEDQPHDRKSDVYNAIAPLSNSHLRRIFI
jgi:hypothetical protein